jgi:integrase
MTHLSPLMADLLSVAIATGMRRNEILSLTPDNLEPAWVRLWKTKKGMPRSVPKSA